MHARFNLVQLGTCKWGYRGTCEHCAHHLNAPRVYIIEREGEYPTSLWDCVTTLYGGHDLYNDIHRLDASVLAVCGHVAKPHVL